MNEPTVYALLHRRVQSRYLALARRDGVDPARHHDQLTRVLEQTCRLLAGQPATSQHSGTLTVSEDESSSALIFEASLPALLALSGGGPDRQAAVALALHRAVLEQLSGPAEQRYLSRELHDRAAPAIALSMRNLELFECYRGTDPDRAELKLAETTGALREAFGIVRALASRARMGPPCAGLVPSLRSYLKTIAAPSSTLTTSGDLTGLPSAAEQEIFLVLREAVRNAVQHARPRHVWLRLAISDNEFQARVCDDGDGFDARSTMADQLGLNSMAERAESLGGAVRIISDAGAGTSVELRVPLPIPT